jgi:hypothetical protein
MVLSFLLLLLLLLPPLLLLPLSIEAVILTLFTVATAGDPF